jgi:hypothetical protein
VIPLAARLGLTPITDFAVEAEAQLASTIIGKAGVVLVSGAPFDFQRSLKQ